MCVCVCIVLCVCMCVCTHVSVIMEVIIRPTQLPRASKSQISEENLQPLFTKAV